MATARSEVVWKDRAAWYHCVSRCVRRGYLQGMNRDSGQDYGHRKEWVQARLGQLTQVFAIEQAAFAVMDNHVHVVLRVDPEKVQAWTDEEIARRWLAIFPSTWTSTELRVPSAKQLRAFLKDPEKLQNARNRLGDLSWVMRCLNEWVARRANLEEQCTGRYWEGRYACQRLADPGALLSTMIYVDLNPVRARLVDRPERSEHTSVRQRIEDRQHHTTSWLKPISEIFHGQGTMPKLTLREYLQLVDATGRRLRSGKRGRIPPTLRPILDRLGLNQNYFVQAMQDLRRLFHYVVGSPSTLRHESEASGRQWRTRSPLSAKLYAQTGA